MFAPGPLEIPLAGDPKRAACFNLDQLWDYIANTAVHARRKSIAGGYDARILYHQYHAFLRRSRPVHDPLGYDEALARPERYAAILEIDDELPVQAEEELVIDIVLVPVIFPLHHSQANDGSVRLA
jgi:hypothetical protein